MKSAKKIIFAVLMIITLLAMFLPIAQFPENTAGALTEDIEKQQGKVDSAATQLQRWIDGGKKSEADIEKQKAKVQKEQDKLDALIAQQEAASNDSANGLSYSLLPGQLPSELQIDEFVKNQYKLYQEEFPAYYACVWITFGCLVAAAVLVVLGGNKDASKFYTFSAFVHLIGILLAVYVVLRLAAFPIALPYGNASLHTIPVIMLIGGARDRQVPEEWLMRLAALLPKAELLLGPYGHWELPFTEVYNVSSRPDIERGIAFLKEHTC